MNIVIACGSMPFGPTTPQYRSLGGSETAALMLGKALAVRGNKVTMFCNLPDQGPDKWPSGQNDDEGVCYLPISQIQSYVTVIQHDLFIAVRDPRLVMMPLQAKKRVLWMHDIATKRGMQKAFDEMSWCIDEVWTVSEWHRQQVHAATGYPLEFIKALRNGIVPVPDVVQFRNEKTLFYGARPERGLENLIREGGVMEHLPDYKLRIAMYAHFPEDMRDYYQMIFARIKEMPNVEYIGGKSQPEMRQEIANATAYIYPTQFEETSCILARECIEQLTPFLTTREGALPETLGVCGTYFEDWIAQNEMTMPEKGSKEWCKLFADFTRNSIERYSFMGAKLCMAQRKDLYWDGVAEMVEKNGEPPRAMAFSRMWSLLQDGDVMPARAFARQAMMQYMNGHGELTEPMARLMDEIFGCYQFIEGNMPDFYEKMYVEKGKTAETELVFAFDRNQSPRWAAIRNEIAKLPPGSRVLEYGCGPGHVLAPLAKEFPLITFVGHDISETALDVVRQGARENKLQNLFVAEKPCPYFDAVICSEVLEHVTEPWLLLNTVEDFCKLGGRMILTVPFGAWEPKSYEREGNWGDRQHLWCIDQKMFKDMQGDKPNHQFLHLPLGMDAHARIQGNLICTYNADHKPAKPVDAYAKAMRHWPRQTCAAAIIAMNNEDTILKLLNSLDRKVQFVQIALGPCKDKTEALTREWFRVRPWMRFKIIPVQKIEAWKFGFDDARNASFADLEKDFEWFLWIDTDEYLAGNFSKYLRTSSLDGYLVAQHHFTVEPRGKPPEIDRPSRLLRLDRGYKARGHIHEHFEVPAEGPGNCVMLPDVDIGHPGYVNEETRRGRFMRNFPFLEWDHKTDGEGRKLHKFLWFRDIIHRMRFIGAQGDHKRALELAQEAITYYNDHTEEMSAFGPGLYMALSYLSEAYKALGKGVSLKVAIQLDDRGSQFEGRFENIDQVFRVLKQLLEPEFKERQSRYY